MRRLLQISMTSALALLVSACGPGEIDGGQSVTRTDEGLGGCHAQASSSIPSSGQYFLTSFGNSAGDDGIMSCGSYTKHGSWYYAASRQRYGCGARIRIEANGKCVVAQTDDYGPDVCVENAAGAPIIDASPLVSEHLFGVRSAGWSDRLRIHVSKVSASTPLGPCMAAGGSPPPQNPPPAHHSGDCHSSTLARDVTSGTCVQSSGDASWYHCQDGTWLAGQSNCTQSYAWCYSHTVGKNLPPRSCVESRGDSQWYQCGSSGWVQPVANGAGPVGACSAEYAL